MRKIMIGLVFVLAAACAPALCKQAAPHETRSGFAPLDDVRLLANGLLQLGQSMREFVQKTRGQINDIFQKLNIFDRSFYQLSVLASEIKEEEEELKKTTVVLQANNEEIRGLSEEINSKMESLLQGKSQLQKKVDGLEEKLSSLSLGAVTTTQVAEINSLREVISSQEQSIMELLNALREQSEQLQHQTQKIKTLEEKLTASMSAQETFDKIPDVFSSEVPTLTPYVASGSPSSTTKDLPSDCGELFSRGERVSGVYAIKPNGSEPFMALCDMSGDHGATVIQRRRDGSINFDQPWEKYENGFGDFQREFWLGLKKIHSLASQGNSILHLQLEDWKQDRRFINYRFYLDGPEKNFTIHVSRLSGNLPNPMSKHMGVMFSTKDRDNRNHLESSCSPQQSGGWWFNTCGDTNLNGRYFQMGPKGRAELRKGIQWRSGRKVFYSLKFTQMSIHHPAASISTDSLSSASSETAVFL